MNKSPAYQHYPDKWLTDTRRLSWAAKGIYKDLLDVIWMQFQDTCSIPDDDAFIADELGAELTDWQAARREILNAHRPLLVLSETNRLLSNGLWKERCKQLSRREQLRNNGKKGGRPRNHKVIRTVSDGATSVNQNESLSSPTPTPIPTPSPTPEGKDKPASKSPDTWMTEFGIIWKARFGGELPYRKFARALEKVVKDYGNEKAQSGFKRYCQDTPAEYANAASFAQKAGYWINGENGGRHGNDADRRRAEKAAREYAEPERPLPIIKL